MSLMNCFGTETFLLPVSLGFEDEVASTWLSYHNPLNIEDELYEQVQRLFDTGLQIGNQTLKFLYNSQLASLEELVQSEYNKLKVTEHPEKIEEEIFYTMKIEGAKTTLARTHALRNGMPIDKHNEYSERMIKNGFAAVKYLNLVPGKFSKDIILQLWKIISNQVCDNLNIMGDEWRADSVFIGDYEAISFKQVPAAIQAFVDFYKKPILSGNVWLKALLLHFAFEVIHPFCDCNGRTGRMIMNKFLIDSGMDKVKAVSFTAQFDKERSRYDVAFVDSENDFLDCTPFLVFGLEAMFRAMKGCNNT